MALTKSDLNQIRGIVETSSQETTNKLRQEMRDWRSDFYDKIDPILNEVQTNREERVVILDKTKQNSDRIKDNRKRIKKLEIGMIAS